MIFIGFEAVVVEDSRRVGRARPSALQPKSSRPGLEGSLAWRARPASASMASTQGLEETHIRQAWAGNSYSSPRIPWNS